MIKALRSLHVDKPVNILEAEGEYGVYVGPNWNRIPEYSKHSGFNAFMAANSIEVVVVSKKLKKDTRFRSDREWQAFLADPAILGFSSISVPDVPQRSILMRSGR